MSLSFPPLSDLTTYGVSPPLDKIILLITILLVYVVDITITRSDAIEQENLSKYLAIEFDIKTLGRLKYFMGIEVAHSSKITWCSKKQNVVAHSSAELEFKALVHQICELLWVKILLIDLKIPLLGSMKL
ncbi:unnamed protein product [Spirodela intermedia]|uniref:Uncharacterized protein n=1 Tax=Spirodela intermedia TaxID=51605 RepID=A0A7I8KSV6_SPIIN|nr:unnamed protein product [Spirodela intermedia]